MGVTTHGGTMEGALTPICEDCMIFLCWDISHEEYAERKSFWDNWKCEDCNGGVRMRRPQPQAEK